ncbi:MAG: DUF455 family protein [Polyangiaceae bacterium]
MAPASASEPALLAEAKRVAPPPGTLEAEAYAYLTSERLTDKFRAPASDREPEEPPRPYLVERPGRPPELVVSDKGARSRSLKRPENRASLVHTFLHHELQAAELMCWAALRFADAPAAFRRGLVAIAADEVRHMIMYRDYLEGLGVAFGDLPVRDWFWERVPTCPTPAHFVATLGLGFEGGNLDHTLRFAARFREAGDEAGARLQETVGREEVAHVRFALKWFRHFTGQVDFDDWVGHLPAPLSPAVMRGRRLDLESRQKAGQDSAFLDRLAAWRFEP